MLRKLLIPVQTVTLLALAIGLAIGTIIVVLYFYDTTVWRPLNTDSSETLVSIGGLPYPSSNGHWPMSIWDSAEAFEALSLYHTGHASLGLDNRIDRQIRVAQVSRQFFDVFDGQVVAGRAPDDDDLNAGTPIAVIGESLSKTLFHQSISRSVGSTIVLNSVPHEIIGILKDDFAFPRGTRVWIPLREPGSTNMTLSRGADRVLPRQPTGRWIGKLRSGVSLSQATARLQTVLASRTEVLSNITGTKFGVGVIRVRTLVEYLSSNVVVSLTVVLACALLLLVLIVINASGAFFATVLSRRKDIEVQRFLGASSQNIACRIIANAVLVVIGALATSGLMVSWVVPFAKRVFGNTLLLGSVDRAIGNPFILSALGCIALAILVTLLFPSLLWLRTTHYSFSTLLDQPGRGSTTLRPLVRTALLTAQLAIVSLLLTIGIATVSNVVQLRNKDLGYQSSQVMVFEILWPPHSNPGAIQMERARVLETLQKLPSIRSVSLTDFLPSDTASGFVYLADPRDQQSKSTHIQRITGDYFTAMSIPLRNGRSFTFGDVGAVVVSETIAEQLGIDVGSTIRFEGATALHEVVGVVGDVAVADRDRGEMGTVYLNGFEKEPLRGASVLETLVVHKQSRGLSLTLEDIQSVSRASGARAMVGTAQSLESLNRDAAAGAELESFLLIVFCVIGTTLTVMAIYAICASVRELRRHEMAVRAALGASSRMLLGTLLKETVVGGFVGVLGGLLAVRWVTQAVVAIVPGVSAVNWWMYVAVAITLGIVVLCSASATLWRVVHQEPARILRADS